MLPIVGVQKTSLIDYPKKISSIFFTPGCNFRCPYCHNPQLVKGAPGLEPIPWELLWEHLQMRRKLLDGVVITGGEPTLHGELLVEFLREVKKLEYLVKLDTNGSQPEVLRRLIDEGLVDYVAMDLKTSLREYAGLIRVQLDVEQIRQSTALLLDSAQAGRIDLEFRTTLHPLLHSESVFYDMLSTIKGAPRYALQTFRRDVTLEPEFQETQPFTESQMQAFAEVARQFVVECLLR